MRSALGGVVGIGLLFWGWQSSAEAALLAVTFDTGNLYQVSTTDASLTLIGATGVFGLGSLETAPDGTLYAFTTGDQASLYTINPVTGAATAVGPLSAEFVFEGGLAFGPDGTAYGTNILGADQNQLSVAELFTLNLATGAATVVGIIPGGFHDINGL